MEIIQASVSCSSLPSLHPLNLLLHQFSPISPRHYFYSPVFPNTVLSVKHKTPISTATRDVLQNGTSDLVVREIMEDMVQLSATDTAICRSSSKVLAQLTTLYDSGRSGYSTADAIISLQKVASQLGYDELNEVTTEDLCIEVVKEIERVVRVKKMMMEEAGRPFRHHVNVQ